MENHSEFDDEPHNLNLEQKFVRTLPYEPTARVKGNKL